MTPKKVKTIKGSNDTMKSERSSNSNSVSCQGDLSPEQKQRMEENRICAKTKLLKSKTHGICTNVGLSWMKALEPEFTKQYFIQVQLCQVST